MVYGPSGIVVKIVHVLDFGIWQEPRMLECLEHSPARWPHLPLSPAGLVIFLASVASFGC